jgi:hypothetical protein
VSTVATRSQEQQARSAFGTSMLISAIRCTLTYVVLPLLGPVLGLTGSVGPVVGLVIGAVSMVAIAFSIRRFWAIDSRFKWGYTIVGSAVFGLLVVQAIIDIADLIG